MLSEISLWSDLKGSKRRLLILTFTFWRIGKRLWKNPGVFTVPSILFRENDSDIMTPEEVARYLKKCKSWVYKNWQLLGGVKLGGYILFPAKKELYECIFFEEQRTELRLRTPGNQVHEGRVQNQTPSKGGRGKKTGRVEEPFTGNSDPDRYNPFRTG